MKHILIISLAFLLACSPNEPTEPDYNIQNPPPNTGQLSGSWGDSMGFVISNAGLYDSYYREMYITDLRVHGTEIWFHAVGSAQVVDFCGNIRGQTITGMRQIHNYSVSQGITYSYPANAHTYTRIQ